MNTVDLIKQLLEVAEFTESSDAEDARRYRFLRQQGGKTFADPLGSQQKVKGIMYDIAIDALMRKAGELG